MNSDVYIDNVNLENEISRIKLRLNKNELYLNFDDTFDAMSYGYKTDNWAKLEEIQNGIKLKLRTIKKNQENDVQIIDKTIDDYNVIYKKQ